MGVGVLVGVGVWVAVTVGVGVTVAVSVGVAVENGTKDSANERLPPPWPSNPVTSIR